MRCAVERVRNRVQLLPPFDPSQLRLGLMSLCDTCRKPGACCSGFVLFRGESTNLLTFWDTDTRDEIVAQLRGMGLPFMPLAKNETWLDPEGKPYSAWTVRCPWLDSAGRCGHYEERPQLCRDYTAGSSPLCVEWQSTFKGIPILKETACAT